MRYLFVLVLLAGCHARPPVVPPVGPPSISMTAAQIEAAAQAGYERFNPDSRAEWKSLSKPEKQMWRDWAVAFAEWQQRKEAIK